jgi:hypothetical protein
MLVRRKGKATPRTDGDGRGVVRLALFALVALLLAVLILSTLNATAPTVSQGTQVPSPREAAAGPLPAVVPTATSLPRLAEPLAPAAVTSGALSGATPSSLGARATSIPISQLPPGWETAEPRSTPTDAGTEVGPALSEPSAPPLRVPPSSPATPAGPSSRISPSAEVPTPDPLGQAPQAAAYSPIASGNDPAAPATVRPASISGSTLLGAESPFFAAEGPLDAEDEYGNIYVVWQELDAGTYETVYVDVYCAQSAGTYCSGKGVGWQGATWLDQTYYDEANGDTGPDIAVSLTGEVCVTWGSSDYDDVWVDCYYGGAWAGSGDFYGTDSIEVEAAIAFDEGGYLVLAVPLPDTTDALEVYKFTVGATLTEDQATDYTAAQTGSYDWAWTFIDSFAITCVQTAATTCAILYDVALSSTEEGIEVIQSTNDFSSISYGPASIAAETWSTAWEGGWFGGKAVVNIEPGGAACSETSADCAVAYAYDSGDAKPNKYIVEYAYSTNGWASGSWAVGNAPSSTEPVSLTSVAIVGSSSPVVAWNTSTTIYITGTVSIAPASSGSWGTDWTISCSGSYMCFPGIAQVTAGGSYTIGANIPWRIDISYPTASDTYYAYFWGPAITSPTSTASVLDIGQSTTFATGTYSGPPVAEGFQISAASGYTWSGLPTGCAGTANSFGCSPTGTGTFSVHVYATDTGGFTSVTMGPVTVTVNSALTAGAISPASPTIDDGQSITLTANPSGGTVPYAYQWYTGAACNTAIGGATTSTYGAAPASTTTYSYRVTDSASTPTSACSAGDTVTVNPALAAGAITPNAPAIDSGQAITLTANPSGGTTPYSYQWYTGAACAAAIGGATFSTYAASPGSTTVYSYKVTDNAHVPVSLCSAGDTVTVNPILVANPVTPASPTIDSGQSITLTANPSGGTAPYSYHWYSSPSNSGACDLGGAGPATSTWLVSPASDTYYCYTVGDSSVGTPAASAASAWDEVFVNEALGAGAITPSAPAIDSGQSITLTSSPSGGTLPYSYQWYTGAACNTAIGGATGSTYNAGPASTTTYTYKVTDSAFSPNSACSPGDTVTVNPALGAGAITPSSPGIDTGQSLTLTAHESGGTAPFSYQWYTGAGCSVAIGGATSSTYLATPGSTTVYTYLVVDSSAAGATSACSLGDTVTVNPDPVANPITPSSPTLDSGQSITLTANPSGGTSPYSYQWYTGASCTGAIGGATGPTYLAAPASSTTYYYEVTDSSAGGALSSCSAGDPITVNPALGAGAITPAAPTIDNGQSITLSANPSGGTLPYGYQWYTGVGCTSAIGGATVSTYNANPSSTTTFYYKVTDSATSPNSACSAGDVVTVNPALGAGAITPAAPTIDNGQAITLTANPSGGTTPYSYQWYLGAGCVTSIGGATSSTLSAGPTSTTLYSYQVTDSSGAGPTSACSPSDTITVDPTLVAGAISPAAPTIDNGQTITLFSNPSGGTPSYTIDWYTGAACNTLIGAATNLLAVPSSTTTFSYKVTDSATSPNSVCSAGDTVTVNPALGAGAVSPSSPAIDDGQSITLSASPSGGTTPYSYQWYTGAACGTAIGGATASTYGAAPSSTTSYSYQVKDSAYSPSTACSAADPVTVNPTLAAGAITPGAPAIDLGQSVTLTSHESGGTGPFSYQWYSSGGCTGAIPGAINPTYNSAPASTSTYSYEVLDSNSAGVATACSAGDTVTVNPDPTAAASANPNPTGTGTNTVLTGTTTGGTAPFTYAWRFDDGSPTSYYVAPTHQFNTSGTYLVEFWANDSAGLSAQGSVTVTVSSLAASASASIDPTDVGVAISFAGGAVGGTGGYSYQWRFDDGSVSTLQDPSYTFTASGAYLVRLFVNDSAADDSQATVLMVINPDPTVAPSANPNPTDANYNTALLSGANGGTSPAYAWHCTSGFTSALSDPTYAFPATGSYTCAVWSNDSWFHATSSVVVTVNDAPLISSISATPSTTDVGYSVALAVSGAGGTGATSYAWSCTSGFKTAVQNPSHAFATAGAVTCRAWFNDSISFATATVALTINDDPSVTASAAPTPTDAGVSVALSGTGTGGTSATYAWRCSNGFTSTLQNPSTSFAAAGSPWCNVWFNDSFFSSLVSVGLTINADPSVTSSASPNPTEVGISTILFATGSGGTSATYAWACTNGFKSAIQNPTTTFAAAGSVVCTTWFNDTWRTSSSPVTITVASDPTITISAARLVMDAGQTLLVSATESGGTPPYVCQWFVNGTAVSASSCASYAFTPSGPGAWTVSASVTDSFNVVAPSNLLTFTVGPALIVTATTAKLTGDLGQAFPFTSSVSGGSSPYVCQWYVGSTAIAGATNCASLSYTPSAPGSFGVYLHVLDSAWGQTNSSTLTITVNADPVLTPTLTTPGVDVGETVNATGSVAGGTAPFTCRWYVNSSLQPGSSCAGLDYVATSPGPLTINATLVDAVGWTYNTGSLVAHVQPRPKVVLSPAAATADAGQGVAFTPALTGGTPAFTCQWFENATLLAGATSCASYTYTPLHGGPYEITVHATDSASPGVTAIGFANITAGPPLLVAVSPTSAQVDVGVSVALTVSALGGSGSYSYSWWVNGVPVAGATASSYTFTPGTAGPASVQADVTDHNGNTVVATASITVNARPTLTISASATETNVGQSVDLGSMASQGTGPYTTVQWLVNGALAGTGSTFVLTEPTPGSYAVNASFVDADGVGAFSATITIMVVQMVLAGSAPTDSEVGVSTPFSVTASGGISPYTYQWSVDGSAVSGATGASFAWVPSGAGTFNVSVNVTDQGGVDESWGRDVTVLPAVSASLALSALAVDLGMAVELTPGANGGEGPYSYVWTLNGSPWNAPPSSGAVYSYTAGAAGSYVIAVEVTDALGGTATSATATLAVAPLPSVELAANTTATTAGSAISFTAAVSGGTGPFGYTWTLNGSLPLSGNGESFVYVPMGGGVYAFSVEVTDSLGKTASSNVVSITVTVNPDFTRTSSTTSSGFPLWILLLVVVAALGALLLLVLLRRRRQHPEAVEAPAALEVGSAGFVAGGVVGASPAVAAGAEAPLDIGDVNAGSADATYTAAPPMVVEVPRTVEGPESAPAPLDGSAPAPPATAPASVAAPASISYISVAEVHPAARARGLSSGEADVSQFPRCPNCGSPLPSAKSECLVCASAKPDAYVDETETPIEETPSAPAEESTAPEAPVGVPPAPDHWEGPSIPEKRPRPEPVAQSAPRPAASVGAPPPPPPPAPELMTPAPPTVAPPAPPKPSVLAPPLAPPPAAPAAPPPPPPAITPPATPAPAPPPEPHGPRELPRTCYVCGTALDASSVCPICGIDWSERSE